MPPIALLGPQRTRPTAGLAADRLEVDGPVALIAAGSEERESRQDDAASAALGRPVRNLRLWETAERILDADGELLGLHRRRLAELRAAEERYELRLRHAMLAARAMRRTAMDAADRGDDPAVTAAAEGDWRDALEVVRRIDARHLDTVTEIDERFAGDARPDRRPAIVAARAEAEEAIADCAAVAVAGGNVRVIRHVLALLDLSHRLHERPLIAWSAGAMALTARIVLFHDRPPQGFGHPRTHARGLGLVRDLLCLPHASERLRLDDGGRVALFARRFAPAHCVTLEAGSLLLVDEHGRPEEARECARLHEDGRPRPWHPGKTAA